MGLYLVESKACLWSQIRLFEVKIALINSNLTFSTVWFGTAVQPGLVWSLTDPVSVNCLHQRWMVFICTISLSLIMLDLLCIETTDFN